MMRRAAADAAHLAFVTACETPAVCRLVLMHGQQVGADMTDRICRKLSVQLR